MSADNHHMEKKSYEIDRDSFEPAYLQLANLLRRQIADGVFRPGDQLPSEAQLCHRYEISPMTVRRSINLLADQGVVNTAQGRGTFVKALELSTASFDLQGLQDQMGRLHALAEQLRSEHNHVFTRFVAGTVSTVILAEAERLRAELIIMGSHGHGNVYHAELDPGCLLSRYDRPYTRQFKRFAGIDV